MTKPAAHSRDTLPAGLRLMDYDIEGLLGVGGFGVVYRAREGNLQRTVAIKEYLPATLATRAEDGRVILRSPDHADAFALGLQSFINEARLLAQFDHPSLVRVFRFWEANGTAYMVMPCYEGPTLYAARKAIEGPPDETWLRALMDPLLGALDCLHREQVFHRDVAPDNILLVADPDAPLGQRPVLLDFGAARRVITDHTQTLTAILKPSFAPIEQYAETTQLRQGPWTDLYGLGAVLHYCITGRTPVPATARTVHDDLASLTQMAPALAQDFDRDYDPALLATIDHALAIRPDQRLASVAAWRASLLNPSMDARGMVSEGAVPTTVALGTQGATAAAGHAAFPPTMVLGKAALDSAAKPQAPAPVTGQLDVRMPKPMAWGLGVLGLSAVVALSAWTVNRTAPTGGATVVAAASVPAGAASAAAAGASAQAGRRPRQVGNDSAKVGATDRTDADTTPKDTPKEARSAPAKPRRKTTPDESAERSAKVAAPGPREACGSRMFIAMAICMKRQCEKPQYRQHAQCVRMREQEEAQHQSQRNF